MAASRTAANAAFVAAVLAVLACTAVYQVDAAVTCSRAEFSRALRTAGFRAQPDSKRVAMLAAINKLGGTKVVASKRELAMFLAQACLETGGLSQKKEGGGERKSYAPYYGRGYLQLTGKFNYAAASKGLYGDNRLVRNPNLVLAETAAWRTAAYYWKTRVHKKGVSSGKFGISTRGINPGECLSAEFRPAVNRRCSIYKKVYRAFKLPGTPSCAGC